MDTTHGWTEYHLVRVKATPAFDALSLMGSEDI